MKTKVGSQEERSASAIRPQSAILQSVLVDSRDQGLREVLEEFNTPPSRYRLVAENYAQMALELIEGKIGHPAIVQLRRASRAKRKAMAGIFARWHSQMMNLESATARAMVQDLLSKLSSLSLSDLEVTAALVDSLANKPKTNIEESN